MSIDLIPIEHLKHLVKLRIEPNATGEEVEALLAQAAGDLSEREGVLKRLERLEPGLTERLARLWCFRGQKAIQLWELLFLKEQNVRSTIDSLHPGVAPEGGDWEAVEGALEEGADRLTHIRSTADEIFARVRLVRNTSVQYEDGRTPVAVSHDIDIRISFARVFRIAEVYATYVDAKDALFLLLDWLTGISIPRRKSPAQQQILLPLTFNEPQIKRLAANIGLISVSLRGAPPKGEYGAIQLWGKFEGDSLAELPQSIEVIARQEAAVNAERWYKVTYTHQDGYVEQPTLEFVFSKTQPRIVFSTKASRDAIDYLVMHFCLALGRA